MISLRSFIYDDIDLLHEYGYGNMTRQEIKKLIDTWNNKEHEGKYFEMFAVEDKEVVGFVSLYQLSESVVSCGPEIFQPNRQKGYGFRAVSEALKIAEDKGYKIALAQIRKDNAPSIALHKKLGFETDGSEYINKKGNSVVIYLKSL